MRLKSYFSGSVQAAMNLARRELGDEALLINARPATPETRYLGAYEVVFGVKPVDHIPSPTLGIPGFECAVVALVGPPGAGKTTTLIKLAAHYGLADGRRTQILSADVHRVGAADQLRALASILGLGCEVMETPVALTQAIEEHRSKHLVLIDTPGLSSREMEDGEGLAQALASPELDTHLVLSASMQPVVLARIAAQYAVFQPKKLILTHIDEIDEHGLAIQAARCSLPVSFLCCGPQIPDDIEPANEHCLIQKRLTQKQHTLGATA
jgi:flagellar biosynthesis protein FlhF